MDSIVSKYTAALHEQMAKIPSEPPGGVKFDKKGNPVDDDTFDAQVFFFTQLTEWGVVWVLRGHHITSHHITSHHILRLSAVRTTPEMKPCY